MTGSVHYYLMSNKLMSNKKGKLALDDEHYASTIELHSSHNYASHN